jgi:EGF domain-specific O-GlcNAc transferase
MNFVYLMLLIFVQFIASEDIIDINLPLNHLSQYFNAQPRFTKRFNETSESSYREYLSSEQHDPDLCWGYEYDCKKPAIVHQCMGNHTGYVESKEAQLDVFYAQADFGEALIL